MSVQAESLGPAIELGAGYETYWAYIPHFVHSPFYVYAYAFGDCLVNSLYGVYEGAREGFAERYLAMLAAGGTKHHSELLAPFGLDARDPAFWQIGLTLIERMIGELEGMEVSKAARVAPLALIPAARHSRARVEEDGKLGSERIAVAKQRWADLVAPVALGRIERDVGGRDQFGDDNADTGAAPTPRLAVTSPVFSAPS